MNGNKFKNKNPTSGFVHAFLNRNKDLVCKKTQATTPDRARVEKSDLLNWHGEVGRRMHEDGRSQQLENPDSIFNMDEIGFNTNAKDVKIILRKGSKRNHTIAFGAPHGHITKAWTKIKFCMGEIQPILNFYM